MNERIEHLMYLAGLTAQGCWDKLDDYDRTAIEKFAELIVQECIDCVRGAGLADDVALRNNLGFNNGIAEGVVHIQKHFGVEE